MKNAASVFKANRDTLVSYFKKSEDEASVSLPVEAVVEVLTAYATHLVVDEDIQKFEAAGNPLLFQ